MPATSNNPTQGPNWRVTYTYGANQNGWKENWYVTVVGGTGAATAAMTAALAVAQQRVGLLGAFALLEAVTITDVATSGNSYTTSALAPPPGVVLGPSYWPLPNYAPSTNATNAAGQYTYERDTVYNAILGARRRAISTAGSCGCVGFRTSGFNTMWRGFPSGLMGC